MNIQLLESSIKGVLSGHSDQFSSMLNARFNIHTKVSAADFQSVQSASQDKHDKIRNFDNKQNLYLRIIDLFETYMKQDKSLIEFFYEYMKSGCLDVPATGWTERAQARRIAKINRFLSRLELWGRDSDEFKIILRLFIYDRKDMVELYLKLRRKILDATALETIINRNMTVSTHNMAKYSKPLVESLDKIMLNINEWIGTTESVLVIFVKKFKISEIIDFIHQAVLSIVQPTTLNIIKATKYVMIAMFIFERSKGISFTESIMQNNPQSPIRSKKLNRTQMMMFTSYANRQPVKLSSISQLKILTRSMDLDQTHKITQKTKFDYTYKLNASGEDAINSRRSFRVDESDSRYVVPPRRQQDPTVSKIRNFMAAYSTSNSRSGLGFNTSRHP